ncbi:unnamed protein product [Adineta steineri]|uniref:Uncharacterized protein n=1 Tax=Adineta steineri TaxID=433720 RepID=A0A818LA69_9BILA|nr:unnamed protein product [Adineta steineri]CAF1037672.1 unnamed protein product [Adineta steineri]CAF1112340.1 unnamed protein product [Adineta steineri]CAF1266644.1 unnamed protein product [Adineta steineri]CAF1278332.1 unnamed protein product [Adineta steineri]
MSAEEQPTENVRRPTPYTEKIQERPEKNPPIVYKPLPPKEFFEKYRTNIDKAIRKVWSKKADDDYVFEPFQSRFNYYDYGGQYNFICELKDGAPTYICCTENFEKEDGDLANDEAERRRRLCVSAS